MVVALNKIDREQANPDDLILELANQGVEIDEINGEVPSARISGLTGLGIDILEDKVIELSKKLKLFEDMECSAQCYVVETNVDE
jgi:translation initiation factor IF-2